MTESDSQNEDRLASVLYLPWATPGLEPARPAGRRHLAAEPREGLPESEPSAVSEDVEAQESLDVDSIDRLVVRRLARKGLSVGEVQRFLDENGVPAEAVDGCIARLQSFGHLDDERLAEHLVDSLHGRKGLGISAVTQELKRRCIDPATIDCVIAGIDDRGELDRATAIAVKRIGQLSSVDDETASRRLTGFLMRKGYSSGVTRRAVASAFMSRRQRGASVRFR
ncbi:regulatory protein RecX [Luethyella okanaganae]|uniref:Regulatory protein RecX n=1 Tax=Luethyella okanaganae TaxID=69372 RepID=A0ABW1VI92_9MICO